MPDISIVLLLPLDVCVHVIVSIGSNFLELRTTYTLLTFKLPNIEFELIKIVKILITCTSHAVISGSSAAVLNQVNF